LKRNIDEPLSNFAYSFNLRPYIESIDAIYANKSGVAWTCYDNGCNPRSSKDFKGQECREATKSTSPGVGGDGQPPQKGTWAAPMCCETTNRDESDDPDEECLMVLDDSACTAAAAGGAPPNFTVGRCRLNTG